MNIVVDCCSSYKIENFESLIDRCTENEIRVISSVSFYELVKNYGSEYAAMTIAEKFPSWYFFDSKHIGFLQTLSALFGKYYNKETQRDESIISVTELAFLKKDEFIVLKNGKKPYISCIPSFENYLKFVDDYLLTNSNLAESRTDTTSDSNDCEFNSDQALIAAEMEFLNKELVIFELGKSNKKTVLKKLAKVMKTKYKQVLEIVSETELPAIIPFQVYQLQKFEKIKDLICENDGFAGIRRANSQF